MPGKRGYRKTLERTVSASCPITFYKDGFRQSSSCVYLDFLFLDLARKDLLDRSETNGWKRWYRKIQIE